MLQTQRLFHNANDVSVVLNDFREGSHAFAYVVGDYLYVGSEVPFNHLWFELASGGLNTEAADVSVELYWALNWHAAVDVIDETKSGDASLGKSGRVTWNVDLDKGWDIKDRSSLISGLDTTNVYNFYWARIKWSADLSAGTILNYVGQKFSTDRELESIYPDLRNDELKEAFETGKTTWDEQAFIAAEAIARDLVSRRIIVSRGQIVDCYVFNEASVHKVAELVYTGLGAAFVENKKTAAAAYEAAMTRGLFRVDCDFDGKLKPSEKTHSTLFMRR